MRSEFEALQSTTAEAEGQQGSEQTESHNRSIAQIYFHTPHLLVQKFTIQMDVERAGCQEQHYADQPQAEDHIQDATRARRRLRNIVVLKPRIHRSQTHTKTCQGTGHEQDDDDRKEHQISIGFEEEIGNDDQGFCQYEQRHNVHTELFTKKAPEDDGGGQHDPKTAAFEADAGEDKTHRHRRQHKAGQTEVHDGNEIFEKEGVQRQVANIEQVNDRQGAQQQQLRPLGRIAEKKFEIFEHQAAGS